MSDFVFLRARTYDPQIGRFLQRDTLFQSGSGPQGLNRYAYAENNPANATDPSGHCPWCIAIVGGSAAIGGVGAGVAYIANHPGNVNPWELAFVTGAGSVAGRGMAVAAVGLAVEGAGAALVASVGVAIQPVLGLLQTPSRWTILPFSQATKFTHGMRGAMQAHHIPEVRHLRAWGHTSEEIGNAPGIVLSRAEHKFITSRLNRELPRGLTYARQQVWEAYQRVYADYPEWPKAVEASFK